MRFWNKANTGNELHIYGVISAEKWEDTDVVAREFAADLTAFNGEDVTLRVNSPGGDVYQAMAIHNVIKAYPGKITAKIDGIAASAATLVTCAADVVTMPKNALYMVHNPAVSLFGSYTAADLTKTAESITAVKETILNTYAAKTNLPREELSAMLDAETWLLADEAKDKGFVDQVDGADARLNFDNENKILFVNSLKIECKDFKNIPALTARIYSRKGDGTMENEKKTDMDNETLLKKLTDLFGGKKDAAQVEKERITALLAKKGVSAAADAIIDAAIVAGDTVQKVEPYLDAVAKAMPKTNDATNEILALIRDNLQSGAENVKANVAQPTDEEERRRKIKQVVDYANAQH